jgi:hypothetical protein
MPRTPRIPGWAFYPVLVCLLLAAAGCGSRGDVAGKVTCKGKPLVWGTVIIVGGDGIPVPGNIEKDGTYRVRGVHIGEGKVAVASPNPKEAYEKARNMARKGQVLSTLSPPDVDPKQWFAIPRKYESPEGSGLTVTVGRGETPFDIDLK